MIRKNNRRLYESILRDIAKTVKRHLNEQAENINIQTYDEACEDFMYENELNDVNDINSELNMIFQNKDNFEQFVTECIEINNQYICDTDYEELETAGWNIYIMDSIKDVLQRWKLNIDVDDYDLIFGKFGIIWYMIENNSLDIELEEHPEADNY